MPVLIPVIDPEILNIPYFAMGSPSSFKETIKKSQPINAKPTLFSSRVLAWMKIEMEKSSIELWETRTIIKPKTAAYMTFLAFADKDVATRFIGEFPSFSCAMRKVNAREKRDAIRASLLDRLKRGDFDIGRFAMDHAYNLSKKYVAEYEKLQDYDKEIQLIQMMEDRASYLAARDT